MIFIRNFFVDFDLRRAIALSFLFHMMIMINYLDLFHFKSKIKPPPELQITFQRLENRESKLQKTEPIPKPIVQPKPIEKKVIPIEKKSEEVIPLKKEPIQQDQTQPQPQLEKASPSQSKANSDIKNAGEVALNEYSNILARHIAKFKEYPRMAQMRGWQGEIVLEVQLNGDGKVISSRLYKGSGYEVLDNEGLDMIKRASPFPVPPDILHGKTFSILVPIRFKLE